MSVWTLVIDEMLVCKLAQYSRSVCCAVHKEYRENSLVWPNPLSRRAGVYRLQYKHPHPATRVTWAVIAD